MLHRVRIITASYNRLSLFQQCNEGMKDIRLYILFTLCNQIIVGTNLGTPDFWVSLNAEQSATERALSLTSHAFLTTELQ